MDHMAIMASYFLIDAKHYSELEIVQTIIERVHLMILIKH